MGYSFGSWPLGIPVGIPAVLPVPLDSLLIEHRFQYPKPVRKSISILWDMLMLSAAQNQARRPNSKVIPV